MFCEEATEQKYGNIIQKDLFPINEILKKYEMLGKKAIKEMNIKNHTTIIIK